MLELYRFTSRSRAEEFMNGRIYMSALGFSWNNGFEGQRDLLEGLAQMQDPAESLLPKEWQEALCAPIMVRAEAFQYCNLLCLSWRFRIPGSRAGAAFDPRMEEFGECAVKITDPDKFFNRIYARAERQGDVCISGPVTYRRFDETVDQADCFDKLDAYSYQREWRIAYLRKPERLKALARKRSKADGMSGYYEDPYVLNVGRLDDVAEIVDAATLVDSSKTNANGRTPDMVPVSRRSLGAAFSGWRGRDEFRNKVLSLDGGSCRPILMMG